MTALVLTFLIALFADLRAQTAQQPAAEVPVSLERVRAGLERAPAISLDVSAHLPRARFSTRVDEIYMLPFKEQFDRLFTLTPLQRQSAEWGARCCGLDLGALAKPIRRALRRREERRIRERVSKELAAVQAAANARGK